ncbi:MAG TPA: diacylglycerol kinase family lipid kinase [Bacteroidales bacterium]|nr:diacylglycerol kinase family lipid kinase [Bacteroidales bacterium]
MTNENKNKFFFLINPNAGNEGGEREWPIIKEKILNHSLEYDFAFTEAVGHAQSIIKEKIEEGYKKFVVVGGDGTLNETINGIFNQNDVPTTDIYIGLMQMGTGNDWARYYNFDTDYEKAIQRLIVGKSCRQDVGRISYESNDGVKSGYFINVAGLCFDSVVVKSTNLMKERGRRTKSAYLISLLRSLIKYRPWELKITINDEIIDGKFLSISIGNGKYSGGGMIQTPAAVINDGFLDVTVYENMPKFKIVLNIKKLYNEKILSIKGVRSFRTKKFKIESKQKIFAETDGEIIGSTPYEISIIPNSINIFV